MGHFKSRHQSGDDDLYLSKGSIASIEHDVMFLPDVIPDDMEKHKAMRDDTLSMHEGFICC